MSLKKKHQSRGHAKYGASKSKQWLNCHGAIALQAKAPPEARSPFAEEGERAHECVEYVIEHRQRSSKNVGKELLALGYTEEMIAHAFEEVRYIVGRVPEGATLLSELEVDSSHFTKEGQFGTVDCAIVELFGRLVVIDYKYGAGVVEEPEENTQGIYYALALAKKYDYNFEEVEIMIIQPRAAHPMGPRRSWVVPMGELIKWEEKFREGVRLSEQPDAPLKSGEWCRWCRAKTICPEISTRAMSRAKIAFAVPEPGKTVVSELHSSPLHFQLQFVEPLETWIKAVREQAEAELYAGRPVPGWKLVPRQGRRNWVDEEAAKKKLYAKFGPKVLEPAALKSPNQVEETFKSIVNFAEVKKLVEAHTAKVSKGFTMAPESDPRPGVNPAKEAFQRADAELTEISAGYADPDWPALIDPDSLQTVKKRKK